MAACARACVIIIIGMGYYVKGEQVLDGGSDVSRAYCIV